MEARSLAAAQDRAGPSSVPCPYAITYAWEKRTREEAKRRTYVNTALDVELETTFEAIAGVQRIIEIFVVTAEAEPGLGVPCSRGLFKVTEGDAGAVLDVIRIHA